MIGVTKLLCGQETAADALRYGRNTSRLPPELLQFSEDKRPIVVWNMTQKCNLKCIHCYAHARDTEFFGELTTDEAKEFIKDLARFGAPVLLFSGGEPLLRKDIFELGSFAHDLGLRTVISTNGTLITTNMAEKIDEANFSYVGISLDGMEETNDCFRGQKGAFKQSLEGIKNCRYAGVKTGLRLTLTQRNFQELPAIFDLIEKEEIQRACFYHLVYSGRGSELIKEDLSREQTRQTADLIFEKSRDFWKRGIKSEILTVDNHADGVYLYLKIKERDPQRAKEVYKLLQWNKGNNSGIAIANVDNLGYV
ncbi:MAG: radical SAM protein, partial [Candidatus Desantisbacteria bacterium]